MTRGKIVLLPFPFDDFSALKVRPAVCLTDPVGKHRHVVVAFITSQISTEILDSDLVLTADHAEFARTGLRVDSTLRLHRLMTGHHQPHQARAWRARTLAANGNLHSSAPVVFILEQHSRSVEI